MKKTLPFQIIAACIASLALGTPLASGQLVLTGPNYAQNFNTISNGLPPGWSVRTNATGNSLGTSAPYAATSKTWGDGTGEFGNCASTISNAGTNFIGNETTGTQGNCTNRALAIRQTSSFGDPGAAFVLQISNTLGVSNLNFSVDLNMLRVNANSNVWSVDYGIGSSPATFTLLGTNTDSGLFGSTTRTFSLGADANHQPANLWIRIAALSPSALTSTRDTFGMDNFTLTYDGSPAAGVRLSIHRDDDQVVLTWEEPGCTLQAAPAPGGTYTNVPGAGSPFTNSVDEAAKFYRLAK